MAGSHGIDVVFFKRGHVLFHVGHRYAASRPAVPFMTVDAVDDQALTVEQNHVISIDFHASEAESIRNDL